MVEGRLSVAELPDAWDEATHRLLGLEIPSVMEGVLQDIHWGAGMIGYFPTYTIGNLMAAQLWRALADDLPDIDGQIAAGDFAPLREWLREQHPPPRAQVRLARAAPAGDGGGAAASSRCSAYLEGKLLDAGLLTAPVRVPRSASERLFD